jgi:hypothetical protein
MSLEGVVDDLHLEVGKLSKNWECALIDKSSMLPGVLEMAMGTRDPIPVGYLLH